MGLTVKQLLLHHQLACLAEGQQRQRPRMRVCRSGSDSLRQLFYALMDLRLHSEYVPVTGQTVEQSNVYKDVISKTSVMAPLPETGGVTPDVPACSMRMCCPLGTPA